MTDIVSIMVEAFTDERARWMYGSRDGDGNYAILTYPGRVVAFTGTAIECDGFFNQQIVQAQLRALHAAGLAVVPVEALPEGVGSFWRVKNTGTVEAGEQGDDTSDYAAYRAMIEAVNAIPVALRENG